MFEIMLMEMSVRRSHRRCFVKKLFLKVSQISQENTSVGVSFLIKLYTSSLETLLKKRLRHRYLPVNFATFLRTTFYRTSLKDCFSRNSQPQYCKSVLFRNIFPFLKKISWRSLR